MKIQETTNRHDVVLEVGLLFADDTGQTVGKIFKLLQVLILLQQGFDEEEILGVQGFRLRTHRGNQSTEVHRFETIIQGKLGCAPGLVSLNGGLFLYWCGGRRPISCHHRSTPIVCQSKTRQRLRNGIFPGGVMRAYPHFGV